MNTPHSLSPLRLKRILAGLTIDLVSLKTGIDRAKISRAERGFVRLSQREIEKISDCLGCEAEDICYE